MLVIPALKRLRQEDHTEFKVMGIPCLKTKQETNKQTKFPPNLFGVVQLSNLI
jgi:hypothetical protein